MTAAFVLTYAAVGAFLGLRNSVRVAWEITLDEDFGHPTEMHWWRSSRPLGCLLATGFFWPIWAALKLRAVRVAGAWLVRPPKEVAQQIENQELEKELTEARKALRIEKLKAAGKACEFCQGTGWHSGARMRCFCCNGTGLK